MDNAFQNIKSLHKVVTSDYQSIDELLKNYLQVGCRILGLDVGIASHITGEDYKVTAVSPNQLGIEPGALFSTKDTYCYEVYKKSKTIHVHQAGKTEPFKSHPVYENLHLESYISAPIFVEKEIYGTINFSSTTERDMDFRDSDIELIELMAESLGRFIKAKMDAEIIEEQNQRLFASAKMNSLGEMAGGIAHEINNPLSIIGASVHLTKTLLNKYPSEKNEKLFDNLQKIDSTVKRISNIIKGMKKLLHDENNSEKEINKVAELISATTDLVSEKVRSQCVRLEIECQIDADVYCNSTQVSQVIINLVNNAVDAIQDQSDPWLKIQAIEKGKKILIRIENSGEKISKDLQTKIFEPFYTTKEAGIGVGLGLSVSKKMAEVNNGYLYYDVEAHNTSFVLELPKYKMAN